MEEVQVGQLVRSLAGRDQGRFYLIYDVLDEAFVRVIDGEKKRLKNPKKKNVKHLSFYSQMAVGIAEKLRTGQTVTEEEIVESVKSLGLSHED